MPSHQVDLCFWRTAVASFLRSVASFLLVIFLIVDDWRGRQWHEGLFFRSFLLRVGFADLVQEGCIWIRELDRYGGEPHGMELGTLKKGSN